MSGSREHLAWVSGECWNVDYLFNTETGRVVLRMALPRRGGTTAGIGRRCGRSFVAVYVTSEGELCVQVDAKRLHVDGLTTATHRESFAGIYSHIAISRPGQPTLTAKMFNGASALLRKVDPGYDELDVLMDDFLANLAEIVNEPDRRARMLEISDAEAGPWEDLE